MPAVALLPSKLPGREEEGRLSEGSEGDREIRVGRDWGRQTELGESKD